jgi:predicted GIY-YIG superfamily endonuclease
MSRLDIDEHRLMVDLDYQDEVMRELQRRRHLPTSDPDSSKFIELNARVRSPWVTSTVQRTRTPSHMTASASTRWSAEGCRLLVKTKCGSVIGRAQLSDGPECDRVCDACVLKHDDWVVYRYFDEDGAILYIGCTNDQFGRMEQHRMSSPWWHEVRSFTAERHSTQAEARASESSAIYAEYPLYNVRGKAPLEAAA